MTMSLSLSLAITNVGGGGEVIPTQAEATALFARMTPAPSADAQTAYNTFFYRLKQCGAYPLLDAVYLGVAEAEPHVRLNLKGTSFSMTSGAQPTFAANGGFYGNGTNQAYNTNFTPSTAGGNYTQNSASLGLYNLDDVQANVDDCGTTNATLRSQFGDGAAQNNPTFPIRINQATTTTVQIPNSKSGSGLRWASRDSSTVVRAGIGRDKLTTVSIASTALSASAILFGGGRSVADPNFSTRRLGALLIGGSLTDAMWAAVSDALDEYMAAMQAVTWTMDSATTAQTIDGIGIELQSDSIEGDGGGIQESNTTSLPLGLSASEQTRFASQVMGLNGGFTDFRLAMGLYYRGTSSNGKQFVERLPGQNAAIKSMVDATGVGVTFTHWSPPPYFKTNVVSGTTYRGSTYTRPDPVTDPSGYNTYLRRLLQGGSLDAPDKVGDPTGYAAWMTDFATNTVATMEYVHQNVGPVRKFCAQNEPTYSGPYPTCAWTSQQMYDYLKVIVPLIRASAILSTYGGVANTVQIVHDDQNGQAGIGSALIRGDAPLLAEISRWSWHKIDEMGQNANWIKDNLATLTANAVSKPVITTENEYFDFRLDPSLPLSYMEPAHRMSNLAMQVVSWMRYLNSPIWYPIHIGKPSTGPTFETEGRAMTIWRPTGAPVRSDYPDMLEGEFRFVNVNWNAISGFLRYGIKGSTRVSFAAANAAFERQCSGLAYLTAGGKYVAVMVNRCRKANGVKLSGLPAGTYKRYRFSLADNNVDMGSIANGDKMVIPADAIEFVVQQ